MHLHRWTKWEVADLKRIRITREGKVTADISAQWRRCTRCGKTQVEQL